MEDISSCLKEIEERYNESEKLRFELKDYNDSIQLSFLDTERKVIIVINKDQGIEVKDETEDKEASVKFEFIEEKTLIDLFNQEIGELKAYSSGKVKVIEGKIKNLLKLKRLLF